MEKETLIVKNFGPIREAELDLRKVTVFIGEQASGKSVLAKLISMLNHDGTDEDYIFMKDLAYYGLDDFYNSKTNIYFENENHVFSVKGNDIKFEYKNHRLYDLKTLINNLLVKSFELGISERDAFKEGNLEISENLSSERENVEKQLNKLRSEIKRLQFQSFNVPTERSLIFHSINPTFSLKYLNDFYTVFNAKKTFTHNLNILPGVIDYALIDEGNEMYKDYISMVDKKLLSITKSSSGVQSLLPLKVIIDTVYRNHKNCFIIEEPELNLYPTTQKKLVEYLIEKCTKGDNRLIITTHSPYVLTALNNCIHAHNVAHLHPESAEQVNELVPAQYQIAYEDVMAYYVADGTVKPIMNEEFKMIDANALDDVSNELGRVFDQLLDLKYQDQD